MNRKKWRELACPCTATAATMCDKEGGLSAPPAHRMRGNDEPPVLPMMLREHADPDQQLYAFRRLAHQAGYHAGRLAELCGVSLRQLERYFQSDYQCPPTRWLTRERFRLARRLLKRTHTIKEVAYAVGFKNNAHFSTAFRSPRFPRDSMSKAGSRS